MGELRLYAIAIDDVRDMFGAPAETAAEAPAEETAAQDSEESTTDVAEGGDDN